MVWISEIFMEIEEWWKLNSLNASCGWLVLIELTIIHRINLLNICKINVFNLLNIFDINALNLRDIFNIDILIFSIIDIIYTIIAIII